MRLMIVGQLEGYISEAGKIALRRGAKVVHCEDVEEAIGALRNGKGADLAMVDVKQNIGNFIASLKKERINVPVIACGIGSDAATAVKAIRDGAKEYVPLPPDADMIAAVLQAVTEENSTMIASAPKMQALLKIVERIAPSDATVLIRGESGTGKEVMSTYIHKTSRRKDGPFIAINCAAIPENLLESELFGHEKGAFTGAVGRRIGKFEEAHGGTLLLDEVSEMHPQLQAKFLRAIQEKEITRVGSNENVKVDVRIVATSNRDLEDSVQKGEFREDLYFRLNVVALDLPPLRDRREDILTLAQFFADKFAEDNGIAKRLIADDTAQLLLNYPWRGNIRELENTMCRGVLMAMQEKIEPEAIMLKDSGFTASVSGGAGASNAPDPNGVSYGAAPSEAPVASAAEGQSYQPAQGDAVPAQSPHDANALKNPGAVLNLVGRTISDVERDMIIDTLDHCLGNRTHAAKILGISIRTLRNKLNLYRDDGVDVPAA
jgi:DNA-binding NtrC family response regulator